jgi:hypothetical protein
MGDVLNEQAGGAEASSQAPGELLDMAATITELIRRHPLGAAALVFGGSVLVGWLIGQDLESRFHARGDQARQKLHEENAHRRDLSHWEGEGGAIHSTDKESGGN